MYRRALSLIALLIVLIPSVQAQNFPDALTPTPVIEPAGNRYILMVLDQPQRDLTHGSSKINMLVDTETGKTWILEFGVKNNQNGYIWNEVPFTPQQR